MDKYLLSENYEESERLFQSPRPTLTIWPVSQFDRQYDILEKLGEGKFGEVFKVVHRKTRKLQAAKILHCSRASEKLRARDEIDLLTGLDHPNVLRLHSAHEDEQTFVQVLELLSGGPLFQRVMASPVELEEDDVAKIMFQICEGCRYLASMNIVHLDLKPENVACVNKHSFWLKLIDFGFARRLDPTSSSAVLRVTEGTPEFVSPEVVNFDPVRGNTDLWSVGVVAYVLLSGLSPFLGDTREETLDNVAQADFRLDEPEFEAVSDEAKDFISGLLLVDPDRRMTAEDALEHPWMKRGQGRDRQRSRKTSYDRMRLRGFLAKSRWHRCANVIAACGKLKEGSGMASTAAASAAGEDVEEKFARWRAIQSDGGETSKLYSNYE